MLVTEFINGVRALKAEVADSKLIADFEDVNRIYMDLPQYFEKQDIYRMYACGAMKDLIERRNCYVKHNLKF